MPLGPFAPAEKEALAFRVFAAGFFSVFDAFSLLFC
jgi:hypothetical protein